MTSPSSSFSRSILARFDRVTDSKIRSLIGDLMGHEHDACLVACVTDTQRNFEGLARVTDEPIERETTMALYNSIKRETETSDAIKIAARSVFANPSDLLSIAIATWVVCDRTDANPLRALLSFLAINRVKNESTLFETVIEHAGSMVRTALISLADIDESGMFIREALVAPPDAGLGVCVHTEQLRQQVARGLLILPQFTDAGIEYKIST